MQTSGSLSHVSARAQLSSAISPKDTEFDGAFYLSVHGIYGRDKIDSGGGAR